MTAQTFKNVFDTCKESQLFHRYITNNHITPLLNKLPTEFAVETIGKSVKNESIYSVTLGCGPKKILFWSQMHGNESTTTKALFDMFNAFRINSDLDFILRSCTIKVIPILNPDGAKAYTRLNANGIDLNRDAQNLSQPESKLLNQLFHEFKPDYCFNLHGQRTIFSAGPHQFPATVSFLAPSQDEACSITRNRQCAMEVIACLNSYLQIQIPNQIGLYDDAFNINCVGDTFQSHNVPTILFEAGHYQNDYEREITRGYIFQSLLVALDYISKHEISGNGYKPYFEIPLNEKRFYDIIIKNTSDLDIAVQFEERLVSENVEFIPKIEKISDLSEFYGHKVINANKHKVLTVNGESLKEGFENDFVSINNELFSLKL